MHSVGWELLYSHHVALTAGLQGNVANVTGLTWPTQMVHVPGPLEGPEPLLEGGVMSRSGM